MHEYRDKQGRPAALISDEVASFISENASAIDAATDQSLDFDYDYLGFEALEKSYLLRMYGSSWSRRSTC